MPQFFLFDWNAPAPPPPPSNEINALPDRLKRAQDEMRNVTVQKRLLVSSMHEGAVERTTELRSELSDLEARLRSLRSEAGAASVARNRARRSVKDNARGARSASTREIKEARSGLVKGNGVSSSRGGRSSCASGARWPTPSRPPQIPVVSSNGEEAGAHRQSVE